MAAVLVAGTVPVAPDRICRCESIVVVIAVADSNLRCCNRLSGESPPVYAPVFVILLNDGLSFLLCMLSAVDV